MAAQTQAGVAVTVLAAAVREAIGGRDEGRPARVDETMGALAYLEGHPSDLPAVITTLRRIANGTLDEAGES